MSGHWETKDGEMIAYEDLRDSHLANILRYIDKKANEGMIDGVFDQFDSDHCVDFIHGDEVKDKLDYVGLLEEVKRRWLLQKIVNSDGEFR